MAFGRLADRLEQHFNGAAGRGWRSHGVTAWCLAVLPLTLLAWLLSLLPGIGWLAEIVLLYLALGLRSLGEHALPVAQALWRHDLPEARRRVACIVSRDTSQLDEEGVAVPPPSRCWRTAAMRCSPRCSGSSSRVRRVWCCTAEQHAGRHVGYRNARFERFGWPRRASTICSITCRHGWSP